MIRSPDHSCFWRLTIITNRDFNGYYSYLKDGDTHGIMYTDSSKFEHNYKSQFYNAILDGYKPIDMNMYCVRFNNNLEPWIITK